MDQQRNTEIAVNEDEVVRQEIKNNPETKRAILKFFARVAIGLSTGALLGSLLISPSIHAVSTIGERYTRDRIQAIATAQAAYPELLQDRLSMIPESLRNASIKLTLLESDNGNLTSKFMCSGIIVSQKDTHIPIPDGSGTNFISGKTLIGLTANHCLEEYENEHWDTLRVKIANPEQVSKDQLGTIGTPVSYEQVFDEDGHPLDLVVFSVFMYDGEEVDAIPLGIDNILPTTVFTQEKDYYTLGFPGTGTGDETTTVIAESLQYDNPYIANNQYNIEKFSGLAAEGMSGSGVVDNQGKLIGTYIAKDVLTAQEMIVQKIPSTIFEYIQKLEDAKDY